VFTKEFTPTPVCGQFMLSPAKVRALVGCVGSSKTSTCIYEIFRIAAMQAPSQFDGIRYTRWAIVRNTLKSIKDTVLKDIQQMFGPIITYRVSESTIYIKQGDIHCEIMLIPLEYEDDQKRLLSSQLTGVYFNEFSEMDPAFVAAALGRCGRYPSQDRGSPSWYGIILDSNPGTEDSPWYPMLKENLPRGWAYFEQPPPFFEGEDGELVENPEAENIEHLPPNNDPDRDPDLPLSYDYYRNLMEGSTPEWAERYVFGRWGRSLDGEPVFKHRFNEEFHVAKGPLLTSYEHPIIIGMDFARAPAAIFGQVTHEGRCVVKREVYAEGTGLEYFVETYVLPVLQEEWCVGRPVYIVGDPSGNIRDRADIDDFDYLRSVGFEAVMAPSNLIAPRIAAVDKWLLRQWDGKAAIQIDPEGCPMLIIALKDRYRYKKKKDGQLEDKPDKKRPWADLADAFQYFCMGTEKRLMGRVMRRLAPPRPAEPPPPAAGWS